MSTDTLTHHPFAKDANLYDWECTDILRVLPIIANVDRSRMKQVCQSRFHELNKMHENYHQLMKKDAVNIFGGPNDSPNPIKPSSQLIVLDLDETVMNQRSFSMQFRSTLDDLWKSVNTHDLVVNFNQLASAEFDATKLKRRIGDRHISLPDIQIGIFRKYFMKFLGFTHNNPLLTYDVMLYSSAISDLVIYQAVSIELYFNFVYAAKNYIDQAAYFKFKYVVSRLNAIGYASKSLSSLMRLIGNNGYVLNKYKNIVIVDDFPWDDEIPRELRINMNIVCYAPSPFEFGLNDTLGPIKLTQMRFQSVMTIRNKDRTFELLIDELRNLPLMPKQERLEWMPLVKLIQRDIREGCI